MTTLLDVLEELNKLGALRRQFRGTGDWEFRKAFVMQEAVFLAKSLELYEQQPELRISIFSLKK